MNHVFVITPFIWEGGPWRGKRTVYAILEGFQRAGYQVHVITATNRRQRTEQQWENIHIHYFHPPWTPSHPPYDAFHSFLTHIAQEQNPWRRHLTFRLFWLHFVWGAARKAQEIARQYPPTFLYGINNPGIPPAWKVARAWNVPFFARIMGSPIIQWMNSPIKLYLARFDELLAFKLPSQALIITDDGTISQEDIHTHLHIPYDRIWLLRNGINKTPFLLGPSREEARQVLGLSPDIPIILWVSQLVSWKHPERLIHALPAILAHHPQTQTIILGDGPLRPDLEQLAHSLGIHDRVQFHGFVPRTQLPLYFHAADIFTAFYDYANIGNSTLEAMLSGLPIVALANGHTDQVVQHLQTGWLIPPHQLDQIPIAINTLLDDPSLRLQLGKQAAQKADDMLWTWEERIDHEIQLIESTLAQTRSNP